MLTNTAAVSRSIWTEIKLLKKQQLRSDKIQIFNKKERISMRTYLNILQLETAGRTQMVKEY